MGSRCSVPRQNLEDMSQSRSIVETALELGYTSADVDEMFRVYALIDQNHFGDAKIDDCIILLGLVNETFGRIILSLFDSEKSGVFNFEEFVITSWNILTNTGKNLAKVVFQLFDTSNSGYLRVIEIKELLTIICGDNSKSVNQFNQEIAKRNIDEDDDMSFEEFYTYVKDSPHLLISVYEVRDRLRRETLGTARWIDIGIKRSTEFGDRPITDVLESLHTKPSCHHLKACSYFHTGVIVHTTKRSMSPSRIDARRLQDSQNETEKELLGLTKCVDIRQAETYGCIKSLQRNDAPQFGRRLSTNGTDDSRHGLRFSRLSFSADQSDVDQTVVEWVDRDRAREREILAAQNNKFDLKNDRVEKLKEIQIGLVSEKGKKNRRNSADLDSSENRHDRPSIFRKEFTTGRRASGSMQGVVDLNSYHDASVVIKKGSNCHRDPSRKRLSMTKTGLYVSRALL